MNIRDDIGQIIVGMEGEKTIRDLFVKKNIKHMQIDLIFNVNGKYKIAEIKHQEAFDPPPFRGHGLPRWQIKARIDFYKETGIEPYLFVVDKKTNTIYFNSLLKLEQGQYFDTNGLKPRRIYNIDNFRVLKLT